MMAITFIASAVIVSFFILFIGAGRIWWTALLMGNDGSHKAA
jgi:hypothetical protein